MVQGVYGRAPQATATTDGVTAARRDAGTLQAVGQHEISMAYLHHQSLSHTVGGPGGRPYEAEGKHW